MLIEPLCKHSWIHSIVLIPLGSASILWYIDTISNLVFWSHLANKLEPWYNVNIIQQ